MSVSRSHFSRSWLLGIVSCVFRTVLAGCDAHRPSGPHKSAPSPRVGAVPDAVFGEKAIVVPAEETDLLIDPGKQAQPPMGLERPTGQAPGEVSTPLADQTIAQLGLMESIVKPDPLVR